MLVIKNLDDLKLYLETRRKMSENIKTAMIASGAQRTLFENGSLYAYSESIKAVEALIREQEESKDVQMPVVQDGTNRVG